MKRPVLNEVSLKSTFLGGGKPSVCVTMSVGQWDRFLQMAYDAGHDLVELDDNEIPLRAFRKEAR